MKVVDQRTSDQVRRILYPSSIVEGSVESLVLRRMLQIAYNESDLKRIIAGSEERRAGSY